MTGRVIIAVLAAGGLAVAAAPSLSSVASDPRVGDVQQVSGPTPFTDDCGDPGGQGTGNPGFEAETQLSVHPDDPDHLLATWQQDRYSGIGGARSNLVAVSRDGGASWSDPTTLPGISACTGGPRFRASDPWGAIGPDGVAYQASMGVTELLATEPRTEPDPIRFDADVTVSRSVDGGAVWEEAVVVARDEGLTWEEKPVIVADPDEPGRAFVVWARHVFPDPVPVITPVDVQMAFARTDDGGLTWTEPAVVPPNVPGVPEWPWVVLALPGEDGPTLVVLYTHFAQRVVFAPVVLGAVTSDDLGETWAEPSVLAVVPNPDAAPIVPSAAVGPDGDVHAVWYEPELDGTSRIRSARSSDRGTTWDVGTVADLGTTVQAESAVPTIAVAGDGTVGVTWYDSRNDVPGDDEVTTDVFLGWSRDRGETWRQRHLAGPFDLDAAAVTEGGRRFLGDYTGLVGLPRGFSALFTMARPQATSGPTDVFQTRIVLPSRGTGHAEGRGCQLGPANCPAGQ